MGLAVDCPWGTRRELLRRLGLPGKAHRLATEHPEENTMELRAGSVRQSSGDVVSKESLRSLQKGDRNRSAPFTI